MSKRLRPGDVASRAPTVPAAPTRPGRGRPTAADAEARCNADRSDAAPDASGEPPLVARARTGSSREALSSTAWETLVIVAIVAALAVNAIVRLCNGPGADRAVRVVPAVNAAQGRDRCGDHCPGHAPQGAARGGAG